MVGDSGASAVAGAQSGKATVENNALSELVPLRVQQDTSLAFDLSGKGSANDEINNAINVSHIGPSWGTTYKVHPVVQAGGDVSIGTYGHTYAISADDNHVSINVGAGVTSWGVSGSKDGIGFSFGVGPFWGICATKFGDVDVNGNTTEELYHHDFN
ncbi:hypothetical protein DXV24_08195 [Escherichia albertii]|uniref:Uncharacterized protein n=1 Tax=Escherichia albertii TaxID=208962 RepID=A0A680PII9_ESCAL|nr:hypothetical protein [Escherichia albertii]EFO1269298.1 hypothetical protein [Escherichia albertii]QTA16938.1 hypothetical protein FYK19_14380 [Escherichia albertii]TBR52059.1 hypothetical protein EYS06_12630 [Escherichia albertii]